MKKQPKKQKEVTKFIFREKATFHLMIYENVQNVAISLAMAGYAIRIAKTSVGFNLYILTDRDL